MFVWARCFGHFCILTFPKWLSQSSTLTHTHWQNCTSSALCTKLLNSTTRQILLISPNVPSHYRCWRSNVITVRCCLPEFHSHFEHWIWPPNFQFDLKIIWRASNIRFIHFFFVVQYYVLVLTISRSFISLIPFTSRFISSLKVFWNEYSFPEST